MNKKDDVVFNITDKKNFRKYLISDLEIDEEKNEFSKYKKKKRLVPFTFFNKKEWKEYIEYIADNIADKKIYVVGNVFINKKRYKEITEEYTKSDKIEDKNYGLVEIKLTQEYIEKHELEYEYAKFDVKESSTTNKNLCLKTIGYAQVGENQYVRLVKHSFFPLILFLLMILLVIGGLLLGFNNSSGNTSDINEVNGNPITSTTQENENNELAENHYLYVWKEKNVSKDQKTVPLINHPDNDVYLCYDIYDDQNNFLDTTGAFEPNTQVDYDFYSLFNGQQGTYNITLLVKVYELESKEPLCTKTMPVVINVK